MYLILTFIFLVIILIRTYLRMSIKICDPNITMKGKVVIVTGGNSGIGFETAKDLARRGAKVILACRNIGRGIEARDKIIKETTNTNVHFKQLDLASFKSVREFAKDILKTESELHVLINNAGVFCNEKTNTEDGILMMMQVNHFSPFLLTQLLLPLLKKSQPSRIINVNSLLHLLGTVPFEDYKELLYNGFVAYGNSKLCNLMTTVELSERLSGSGVVANSLHPGIISTNISSNCSNIIYNGGFSIACWFNNLTNFTGAQTSIYLATDEGGTVSGKYFVNCSPSFLISSKVKDGGLRKKLWKYSNKVIEFDDKEN